MEVFSSNRHAKRQINHSIGKENIQTTIFYSPICHKLKKSVRKKYIELHTLRKNSQINCTFQSTLPSAKNHIPHQYHPHTSVQYWTNSSCYRFDKPNWLIGMVAAKKDALCRLLSYLDINSSVSLFNTCKLFRGHQTTQLLTHHIDIKIVQGTLSVKQLNFLCLRKAEYSSRDQLIFYSTIPCKISDEIYEDVYSLVKDQTKVQTISKIIRSVHLKHSQLMYHRSLTYLVQRLIQNLPLNMAFVVLQVLLEKMSLAEIYNTHNSSHRLHDLIKGLLDFHAGHLTTQEKERAIIIVVNKWLRPFFNEKLLSHEEWLAFFLMFMNRGWVVVTVLLVHLIRIRFSNSDASLVINSQPNAKGFFKQIRLGSLQLKNQPECEKQFIEYFTQHKQVTQPRERSECITHIGGKSRQNATRRLKRLNITSSESIATHDHSFSLHA